MSDTSRKTPAAKPIDPHGIGAVAPTALAVGTTVDYYPILPLMDASEVQHYPPIRTKTRTPAWSIGHTWLVSLEGKTGGVCVTHVRPVFGDVEEEDSTIMSDTVKPAGILFHVPAKSSCTDCALDVINGEVCPFKLREKTDMPGGCTRTATYDEPGPLCLAAQQAYKSMSDELAATTEAMNYWIEEARRCDRAAKDYLDALHFVGEALGVVPKPDNGDEEKISGEFIAASPAYRLARLKAQGAEPGWYGPDGKMCFYYEGNVTWGVRATLTEDEARLCGFVEVPHE